MQKDATTKAVALATLEKAGNIKMLNPKQCQIIDQMMDHYFSEDVNQFFFHIDNVTGTSKFTYINIISQYIAYHIA